MARQISQPRMAHDSSFAAHALAMAAVASILIMWRRSHLAQEARHLAVAAVSKTAAAVRDASLLAEIDVLHAAAVDATAEMARIRSGLDALARSTSVDLWIPIPKPPVAFTANEGWSRCTDALAMAQAGYASSKGRSSTAHKKLLMSRFDCTRGGGPEKAYIDALLAKHALRVWPDLAASLATSPHLVLLLLEAPSCATTSALVAAIPELREYGSRICIPQGDPSHYAQMINAREGKGAEECAATGVAAGESKASRHAVAGVASGAGMPVPEEEGAARSMLLNVRSRGSACDIWVEHRQ